MIIALTTDEDTVELASYLAETYPNDTVHGIDSFLVSDEEFVQVERNEKLPERITFIGHGSPFKFGPYTPEELGDYIVEQVSEAAEIEPGLKQSLKKFDFVGCNVGAIRNEDTDFYLFKVAEIVEKKLNKKGFDVEVMGFTTQNLNEKGEKCHSSVFNLNRSDPTNPKFSYYAYPTKENREKVSYLNGANAKIVEEVKGLNHQLFKLNKQIKENPIEKKSKQFTEEIGQLKLKAKENIKARDDLKEKASAFQEKVDQLKSPSEGQLKKIAAYKQDIKKEYAVLLEEKEEISSKYETVRSNQKKFEKSPENGQLQQLKDKRDEVKEKIDVKKTAIEKNKARIKENIREIYHTDDVRQTLDKDPNCSCTKLLRKSNMTPEQRESLQSTKVKNVSVETGGVYRP